MNPKPILKNFNPQPFITPAGEKMVIMSEAELEAIVALARGEIEDLEDAAEANRIIARIARGEEETFPFELLKRLKTESPIKVFREHRGLTQRALADAIGSSAMYISQLETGVARGGRDLLAKIAVALRVAPDLIVQRDRPTDPLRAGTRAIDLVRTPKRKSKKQATN